METKLTFGYDGLAPIGQPTLVSSLIKNFILKATIFLSM